MRPVPLARKCPVSLASSNLAVMSLYLFLCAAVCLWPGFSPGGRFCPPPPGDIRQYLETFFTVTIGRGCLLRLTGGGQGRCSAPCDAQPVQRTTQPQWPQCPSRKTRFRVGGAHFPRREETASVTAFTEIRKGVNGKPPGTNTSAGDKQNFRDPDIWGAGVKVNQVALWGAEQTISSTPEAPAHLARTFLAAAYQTLAVDSGRSNMPSGRVLEGEELCAALLPSQAVLTSQTPPSSPQLKSPTETSQQPTHATRADSLMAWAASQWTVTLSRGSQPTSAGGKDPGK